MALSDGALDTETTRLRWHFGIEHPSSYLRLNALDPIGTEPAPTASIHPASGSLVATVRRATTA
jgi:hypothetical protein